MLKSLSRCPAVCCIPLQANSVGAHRLCTFQHAPCVPCFLLGYAEDMVCTTAGLTDVCYWNIEASAASLKAQLAVICPTFCQIMHQSYMVLLFDGILLGILYFRVLVGRSLILLAEL